MSDEEIVDVIRAYQEKTRLTAGHRYQVLMNGTKWEYVPGTTTIIKTLAAPQLLDWAARLGAETGDPKAHIKARDEAAGKGTDLHALIERECRVMMGETLPALTATEDELMALARWARWAKENEFRPLAVEFRVFSARPMYAGTVDVLGYVRGALVIGDWKSSARVYAEHHMQNAAYRHAFAQMTGMDAPGGCLVRVPRDGDLVAEKPGTTNVEGTMRAFEGLLATYLWQREIKREMEAA